MPDEPKQINAPEDSVETTEPIIIKDAQVSFMTKKGFKNPPPQKLKMITDTIMAFCAGLTTSVAATDLFTGRQPKIICFILGVIWLACFAIQKGTGVTTSENKTL